MRLMQDSEDPALQSYRQLPANLPLRQLLAQGPWPPVEPVVTHSPPVGLRHLVLLCIAAALTRILVPNFPWWASLLAILFAILLIGASSNVRARRRASRAHELVLMAMLEDAQLPMHGYSSWFLRPGQPQFGAIRIRLVGYHPQIEAVVRLSEPDAVISWPSPSVLQVIPNWERRYGIERLRRLVCDVLIAHQDELGIQTIEFLSLASVLVLSSSPSSATPEA